MAPMKRQLDPFKRKINEELRMKFKDSIDASFLIRIKSEIEERVGVELYSIFEIKLQSDMIFTDEVHFYYIELCKIIIGIHKSNTLYLTNQERNQLESSNDYNEKLINQVVENLKLRPFAGKFFRKNPISVGDELLYFPVAYDMFALCVKALSFINPTSKLMFFYVSIFNKALATFTLVENNFFDSAYPLVRGMVEIYIKMIVFRNYPNICDEYQKFIQYDLDKKKNGGKYTDSFNDKYNSRLGGWCNKSDYLNFGWVDLIPEYHHISKKRPFSIYGILDYMEGMEIDAKGYISLLTNHYTNCHSYTHGTKGNNGYPLSHYFNLMITIWLVVPEAYKMLCKDEKINPLINEINIINKLEEDSEVMIKQRKNTTKERLATYYLKMERFA